MGQQKYSSQRTRTQHTYEFFKERQNDPAWRDDFYEFKQFGAVIDYSKSV